MPSQQKSKAEERWDLESIWGFMKHREEQLGIPSMTQQRFYRSHLRQSVHFLIFFSRNRSKKATEECSGGSHLRL